jgi:hypothetical protein
VSYFNGLQNFCLYVQFPGVVIGVLAGELEKKSAAVPKMNLSLPGYAQEMQPVYCRQFAISG